MKICLNCGAKLEDNISNCPYCGYINKETAEKNFNDKIDEIKDNIADVKKEPARAFKRSMSKGVKVIIWSVAVILVIGAIIAGLTIYSLKDKPKMFLSAEEEAYASAYREKAGKELDAAYEEKNIELMAQIYDKAYYEEKIALWGCEHYDAAYEASCYMKLQECLPNLDKETLDIKEAEEITYYCFFFYYKAYGDDGAEMFDPIRENEIIPLLNDRLGFTDEDMEAFRDKVTDPPYVVRSKVIGIVKDNYKNYH